MLGNMLLAGIIDHFEKFKMASNMAAISGWYVQYWYIYSTKVTSYIAMNSQTF